MIEQMESRIDDTLEFKISGKVTGEDYDSVLVPAIESALEERDRIKILCQIGPGFEGYSLDAAWDDARLGLKHWKGFERAAIVTDVDWVKTMVRALGFIMPCPVMTFDLDEIVGARRWLFESLGGIRIEEGPDNVLRVQLLGKLEASEYDGVSDQLDAYIAKHGHIRLFLDLTKFDGWQGLGALSEHFTLVRDHHHAPNRVAVVGDEEWQRMAQRVFSRFVDADMKYFDASDYDGARAWLEAGAGH